MDAASAATKDAGSILVMLLVPTQHRRESDASTYRIAAKCCSVKAARKTQWNPASSKNGQKGRNNETHKPTGSMHPVPTQDRGAEATSRRIPGSSFLPQPKTTHHRTAQDSLQSASLRGHTQELRTQKEQIRRTLGIMACATERKTK